MKMKIAILTGGGDCPGLNGAIKWVTKSALDSRMAANRSVSFEVVGLVEGWKGILEVDPDDQKSCVRYIKHLDESLWGNKSGNIADKSL
jgi:6-phosphofructokinase 1